MKLARVPIAAVLVAILASGCAYRTELLSEPSGADVTVNGRYLGKTPVELEDRSGVRRAYFVTLEKAGYEKVEVEVESVYKADWSLLLLIPGILPYFFTASLEDQYSFLLRQQP